VADSGLSVKERPIIFSGPLIPHILDGSKTQTRRPVKADWAGYIGGIDDNHDDPSLWGAGGNDGVWYVLGRGHRDTRHGGTCSCACPYGEPGDRLWVRETWCNATPPDRTIPVQYRADWPPHEFGPRWKPSIYMPRWASRILLEVTEVRVERVQSITEDDARAEGVEPGPGHRLYPGTGAARSMSYTSGFVIAWDGIYGKREQGWDVNPWVWVVVFRNIAL
jgi:hypothetical protein